MNSIIQHDLTESDYHSQTGEKTPLFSYSVAKTLLHKSAYHAWLQHPLLGNQPRTPTAAMVKGSIIHGLLLGSGPEVVTIYADNFRTKAAQETRDEVYAEGKIPILEKDIGSIDEGIETIKKNIKQLAPYFFNPTETELSVRWEMDNGVKCQSRLDWIKPEIGKIIDLKTISADNTLNSINIS